MHTLQTCPLATTIRTALAQGEADGALIDIVNGDPSLQPMTHFGADAWQPVGDDVLLPACALDAGGFSQHAHEVFVFVARQTGILLNEAECGLALTW